MRKIFFIAIIVMLTCAGKTQAQFGVNVGYALNSINYTDFGGKQNMNGFLAGLSYDFRIKNEWCLFTGLNYSQFGRTNKQQISPIYSVEKSYRHGFLEIPIHAAYVMEVADNVRISIEAGPKLSYAVIGTEKIKDAVGNNETNIYAKENHISPFNVLVGFGVGVQYYHFRFKFGYDFGLLNQSSSIDSKASRSGLSLSLGYLFWHSR